MPPLDVLVTKSLGDRLLVRHALQSFREYGAPEKCSEEALGLALGKLLVFLQGRLVGLWRAQGEFCCCSETNHIGRVAGGIK